MNAQPSKKCSIEVADSSLEFTLQRTSRRKTVGIFVEPGGGVSVLAPSDAGETRIAQIVCSKIRWIRKQQRAVEALPPPPAPREWVNGETHRYLGRQYRLRIKPAEQESVKLVGQYFEVKLPVPRDRERIKELMEQWYQAHASKLLRKRVNEAIEATTWLDVERPKIVIRRLKKHWGSTSQSGRITFNVDLVKLPLSCIDYVVVHELVHLVIPNHSPAFWRMLDRVMPDWRRWRDRLWGMEI